MISNSTLKNKHKSCTSYTKLYNSYHVFIQFVKNERKNYKNAEEFMLAKQIIPEWGTMNQYQWLNPFKPSSDLPKTLTKIPKSYFYAFKAAEMWELEQVLEDKPAVLQIAWLSEEEVFDFANEYKLVVARDWDKHLVVAKDQKAMARVLTAQDQRELGLALGYIDIGTQFGTKYRSARKAFKKLFNNIVGGKK